jgi:hypothetical protein
MTRPENGANGGFSKYFPNEVKLVILLFVLLLSCFALSGLWHEFNPSPIPNISVSLTEFDYTAFDDSNVCSTVVVKPYNLGGSVSYPVSFITGSRTLGTIDASVYKEPVVTAFCFPSSLLSDGDNVIEVFSGNKRLFFHTKKVQGSKPPEEPSLEIIDANSDFITFSFRSKSLSSYRPVKITVNGAIDHLFYPQSGSVVTAEKISTEDGSNTVGLLYGPLYRETTIVKEPVQRVPVLFGALLFSLLIGVLMLFVFSSYPFYEKLSLSFVFSASILIAVTFILNFFRILSLTSFITLFLIVLFSLLFFFRKNLKTTFSRLSLMKMHPLVFIVLIIALGTPLFFHLTSADHISYWNGFYERHSQTFAENFSQPIFDDLSYFGRIIGFIPGYFFLEASLSWLFGLSGTSLFAVVLLLANIIFFAAVFYFGEALSLSLPKRALLFMLLWFESFIRVGITISPRHAISLALLLIALAILIKRKNYVLSAVVLGTGAFIQTPILAAFPVLYIIMAKKIEWKTMLKATLLASLVFGILYAPNFFAFGMLEQAEAKNWGYLIDYTAENLFYDMGPLIVFFLIFHLISLVKGDIKFDSYSKKLAIAAVLGLLFQFFVSYRWNVYNAVNIGVLLVYWFPQSALSERYAARVLATTFIIAALLVNLSTGPYSLTTFQKGPLEFIEENTAYGARILSDPLFGHSIEYVAGRRVMADLAVEYADQQKLLATYQFLENKDYSVLQDYKIDYVVSQADMVNRNAFRNKRLRQPLEFGGLNKIYDNDFIFVHHVTREGG